MISSPSRSTIVALFCRVKSLVRLKMLTDELRARSIGSDTIQPARRGQAATSRCARAAFSSSTIAPPAAERIKIARSRPP